jgi:hypothetical protein
MCYYVQKIYNMEVIKMRAEFTKDENGTVRKAHFLLMSVYVDMVLLRISDNSEAS